MRRTSSRALWAVVGISVVLALLWWRRPIPPAPPPLVDSRDSTQIAQPRHFVPDDSRESEIRELARLRDAVTTLRTANASLSNELTLLRAELARLKAASAAMPSAAEPIAFTIGHGIGPVALGMSVEQLQQVLGAPFHQIGPDPKGNTALVYTNLGISPVVSNGTVIAIQAGTNFQGRTVHGIGAGTARSVVWAALGQPRSSLELSDGSVEDTYPGMRVRFGPNGVANHFLIRPPDSF